MPWPPASIKRAPLSLLPFESGPHSTSGLTPPGAHGFWGPAIRSTFCLMRVLEFPANTPGRIGAGIVGETEECVAGTIAYISNAGSKEIFAFDMDPASGRLRLIERVPVPGTDLPSPTSLPLAVSPDHRFLYAALRSPPFAASSFAIDQSSGRLSQLAVTPLLCAMAYIVTDRSGRFLLAASYTNARLAIYPIDAAGRIEACPTQVTPTGPNAHCVLIDAANRFAYSAVLGADHVMQLMFDPKTGTFAPNAPPTVTTRPRSGPRHLALHPSGRFIHLLNQTDATIVAYRIEPGSGVCRRSRQSRRCRRIF